MKTTTLKKATQITMFLVLLFITAVITKGTILNIKQLYGSEKTTNTTMTCFTDLFY